MELKEGIYTIPVGCVVKHHDNIFEVRQSQRKILGEGEYRCKDCIHRKEGYGRNTGFYKTMVCYKQPTDKVNKLGQQCYVVANKYDKICNNFKLREL